MDRLREVRLCAARLRDELLRAPAVRYYASFSLIRAPYPAKYAFLNALSLPTPFVHILNRLFVIQVDTDAGIKTLLASPSALDGNAAPPFFKRLADCMGPFLALGKRLRGPPLAPVALGLARLCTGGRADARVVVGAVGLFLLAGLIEGVFRPSVPDPAARLAMAVVNGTLLALYLLRAGRTHD